MRATATLGRPPGPCVVNQDRPHSLCGDAKEVGSALPFNVLLPYKSDIGLMDQGRCLKGVSSRLGAHGPLGLTPKFGVHSRHKLIQGRAISTAPGLKQGGNATVRGRWH
jgi:hypothetical protein